MNSCKELDYDEVLILPFDEAATFAWPERVSKPDKFCLILGGLVCLARFVWPERVCKPDKACLVPR